MTRPHRTMTAALAATAAACAALLGAAAGGAPARAQGNDGLLPVGKKAPAFSLPNPKGGTIALQNTLKNKKAVLVNFWFYN